MVVLRFSIRGSMRLRPANAVYPGSGIALGKEKGGPFPEQIRKFRRCRKKNGGIAAGKKPVLSLPTTEMPTSLPPLTGLWCTQSDMRLPIGLRRFCCPTLRFNGIVVDSGVRSGGWGGNFHRPILSGSRAPEKTRQCASDWTWKIPSPYRMGCYVIPRGVQLRSDPCPVRCRTDCHLYR